MLYPLLLQPAFKDYLWGGNRLREQFGKNTDMEPLAESWELSCHRDGLSIIANGEYANKTLAEVLKEFPQWIGTKNTSSHFPLLIKLIDAKKNLSIQVHPDEAYAQLHEGESGKTEMWYVLDAEKGATLIYGFSKNITKEEFARRIQDNTLLEICNVVPIHKGDVFFIEAGTLHAIGEGALIAEIQQSSNSTYRVYDYGRLGKDGQPRPLHIEKALAVTKLTTETHDAKPLARFPYFADFKQTILEECDLFKVTHFEIQGQCPLVAHMDTFHSILVTEGHLALNYLSESIALEKGQSVFIPAGFGEYILSGCGEVLHTTL